MCGRGETILAPARSGDLGEGVGIARGRPLHTSESARVSADTSRIFPLLAPCSNHTDSPPKKGVEMAPSPFPHSFFVQLAPEANILLFPSTTNSAHIPHPSLGFACVERGRVVPWLPHLSRSGDGKNCSRGKSVCSPRTKRGDGGKKKRGREVGRCQSGVGAGLGGRRGLLAACLDMQT